MSQCTSKVSAHNVLMSQCTSKLSAHNVLMIHHAEHKIFMTHYTQYLLLIVTIMFLHTYTHSSTYGQGVCLKVHCTAMVYTHNVLMTHYSQDVRKKCSYDLFYSQDVCTQCTHHSIIIRHLDDSTMYFFR